MFYVDLAEYHGDYIVGMTSDLDEEQEVTMMLTRGCDVSEQEQCCPPYTPHTNDGHSVHSPELANR